MTSKLTPELTRELTPENVAAYLQRHPEFFNDYAEQLSSLSIPHPHGGRAIPLSERQMLTLREKNKVLEQKLAELLHYGQQNDAIAEKMQRWTRAMLLQDNPQHLPSTLLFELSQQFDLPEVGLRLWGLRDGYADLPCAQPVAVDTILFANSLAKPYCGRADTKFDAVQWLPGAGQSVQSLALIALRAPTGQGNAAESFGLLVLGARNPDRFSDAHGTVFLERIGEFASAALARMVD